MLMPHPAVLRRLVNEYEVLSAAVAASEQADPSTRLHDLAYTLCVSTGTRDVERALEVAHQWLATAPAPVREITPSTVIERRMATPEPA
ncbi:DUF5133 domain-containing protein [Streptomyces azureus]|uniref:DUF5133 domain-containing protein n=1 Tax=Streptomyces azureus TaxID=146537 RepID=A0A0K8PIZ6_STRAJ|nr:DUF5133 domain-containing protein [Streptomyces azureus]GAP47703.1 predicted protein [Streptomyces azureus]